MTEPLLKLTVLTKRFGERTVVDRVSLEAGEGEIVALLRAHLSAVHGCYCSMSRFLASMRI